MQHVLGELLGDLFVEQIDQERFCRHPKCVGSVNQETVHQHRLTTFVGCFTAAFGAILLTLLIPDCHRVRRGLDLLV